MSNPILSTRRKPDITYPCTWDYNAIGTSEEKLKAVILAACVPAVPTITLSNVSAKGTYYSLNASLVVEDEAMRLRIFSSIENSPDVKLVI